MTAFFLPSCKVKAGYPRESARLENYIQEKMNIAPLGCCRVNYQNFTEEDKVLVVCNNCSKIVAESSKAGNIQFIWEMIDEDENFVFPDYHGQKMTVQDCWITRENRGLQNTVRSLMKKMNIEIVEIENNYEKADYCGINLTSPPNESNLKLAPQLWNQKFPEASKIMSKEEQEEYFRTYCEQFTTEKVVCYCRSCAVGITMGRGNGIHLIELLFPESN